MQRGSARCIGSGIGWGIIFGRCNLFFPSLNGRNINRTLRDVLKKINVPASSRYSSHGVRRGAAQELKESASQWSIVASLGQWSSLCFKGYVDLSGEMAQEMGKLFIDSYDFESDEEEPQRV